MSNTDFGRQLTNWLVCRSPATTLALADASVAPAHVPRKWADSLCRRFHESLESINSYPTHVARLAAYCAVPINPHATLTSIRSPYLRPMHHAMLAALLLDALAAFPAGFSLDMDQEHAQMYLNNDKLVKDRVHGTAFEPNSVRSTTTRQNQVCIKSQTDKTSANHTKAISAAHLAHLTRQALRSMNYVRVQLEKQAINKPQKLTAFVAPRSNGEINVASYLQDFMQDQPKHQAGRNQHFNSVNAIFTARLLLEVWYDALVQIVSLNFLSRELTWNMPTQFTLLWPHTTRN